MSKIIQPRKDIPIQNLYSFEGEGDYTLCLYYINHYTAKVRITYHTNVSSSPIIYIYSLDGTEYETFSYSDTIYTQSIQLYKTDDLHSLIPKVIIQTHESLEFNNPYVNNSIESILLLNPEYEYRFFTSTDRRMFIQTHFNTDVIKAYDLLVSGAYQADLFRYCYLFIEGGCYIDCKMIQRIPFRSLLKEDTKFVTCIDYERTNQLNRTTGTSLLNSIICSCPKDLRLRDMIDACVDNILNRRYFFETTDIIHILDITGPTLFYQTIRHQLKDNEILLKYIIDGSEDNYKNLRICHIDTKEDFFSKSCFKYTPNNHYSELWIKKELFYRNETILGDYKILTYPHPFNDIFEYTITNKGLCIYRLQNEGWGLELVIKLIHIPTSEHFIIQVGSNPTSTKYIQFSFRELDLPPNVLYSTNVTRDTFNFNEKDIVMAIPSIIHISNVCLRQTSNPVEERYRQTLEQLKSIKYHNSIQVILQEMSLCLTQEQLNTLAKYCHTIILYTTYPKTYNYCHVFSEYSKGLGEMAVLHHLGMYIRNQPFKSFIKFGGRYQLEETFSIDTICNAYPTFSILDKAGIYNNLVYTVMYSIPKEYYNYYLEFIGMWLKEDTTLTIEQIFTKMYDSFDHRIHLHKMGIKGYCVGSKKYLEL